MTSTHYPITQEDAIPVIRECLASGNISDLQSFLRLNPNVFVKDPEVFAYISTELINSGLIRDWPCVFFGKNLNSFTRDFSFNTEKELTRSYLMDCKLFPTVGPKKAADEWYYTTRLTFEYLGRPRYFPLNWDAFLWGHTKPVLDEHSNKFNSPALKQLIDVVDAFIYDKTLSTNQVLLRNFRVSYMQIQKQPLNWLLHENVSNYFFKSTNQVSYLGYPGSMTFLLTLIEFCWLDYNTDLIRVVYTDKIRDITEDLYFHKSNTYTESLDRYQVI